MTGEIEPFRIGLWVGGAVSPNWYKEAADQITEVRDSPRSKRTGVLQTLACPWCGTKLAAHRDLKPDDDRRRILLYCPSGEGPDRCPFSEMGSPGEGLPILTVDEEIYRLLPSLVIATVDKLAQLPWHGYAGNAVRPGEPVVPAAWIPARGHGRADRLPQHAPATPTGLPAATSQPVIRLRPPDLDHPGRTAPDLRRARHHRRPVRGRRRRALRLAV